MRVTFANQFRGIAAILVLISHYYGSIFFQQDYITSITGAHKVNLDVNSFFLPKVIAQHYFNIFLGPLGVAMFFMVSGFVVMFSLDKISSSQFLVQRFFRIFPTYWLSLLICFVLTLISSYYFGGASGYISLDFKVIAANILLVYEYFLYPSINFVNWTLPVEILFYIIMALGVRSVRDRETFLFSSAAILAGVAIYLNFTGVNSIASDVLRVTVMKLKYVSFMLSGVAVYLHFKGIIKSSKLSVLLAFFMLIFASLLYAEYKPPVFFGYLNNYLYGFIVFMIFYFFRDHSKDNILLDFMAKISYPLYLIHSTCGYVMIPILLSLGLGFYTSSIMSIVVSIIISYLMHVTVEVYSVNLGKSLSNKLSENPA
ncbi:acyltransferase [Pantoea sp. DY-15]|uniref:acyltransferase family protein n=1 Tax=Pantoea sp. DY-15 TaxID=2871489 RepID=UPI001C942754|nr:acyltransferase [Pantoea sp. DY-15]MBY4887685.1 acyltransferase [Pantoea sp. DY-15]